MTVPAPISAVKLALAAQRRRDEAAGADLLQSEPIAIIGLGCRFPGGASTPDRFWQLLQSGKDAIREISADRWDIDAFYDPDPHTAGKMSSRWAGLLDGVDQFDAEFFGIAPREAAGLDPQQRMLLEVTWDALNDAGYPAEKMNGTDAGVFFAVYNSDYARLQFSQLSSINAHTSSGTSHGVAAGRLSYLLNLHGPSMAIDTACSSSLVAIHLACQSLRAGECSFVVAGGVNVLLTPEETISLSRWGMLAPDGRCKTFDAAANGFVRGEGCGVIALKRLADALADDDRVYAVIRGSAVNQDGRSTVLTAPNGLAQQAVLRQALKNARVAPAQISYVEAHGTGTSLGDPIEVEALAAVIGQPRADGTVCRVGSVKTNMGHLEAASGVAGLIKVVLALQHETIPPHLHFKKLNPLISLDGTCLEIGREAAPWKSSAHPRFAGVSSFGFGGTNAHIVLEEAPRLPGRADVPPDDIAGPWILPISARNPAALLALARGYREFLTTGPGATTAVPEFCSTATLRRRHYPVRAAFVGGTRSELAERIQAFVDATASASSSLAAERGKLAMVFCGHGAHWTRMGRALVGRESVFRESMQGCDVVIRALTGWSVLDELALAEEHSRLDQTEFLQPVLFALQTSLAALWRSWGVVPSAVLGHSVGEIAAAHVAGALTLKDAAKIAVLRGRLMQATANDGAMAAMEIEVEQARSIITRAYPALTLAAINGPRSITIAGAVQDVDRFVAEMTGRGGVARRLKVNRAFHTPVMAGAALELATRLVGLEPAETTIPFFSTVEGRLTSGRVLDPAYWGRNVREPVRFAAAVGAALQAGCSVFLEVGPHPALASALKQCAEAGNCKVTLLASLRRGQDERTSLLQALGSLYSSGWDIAWKTMYPAELRPVSLPPYPWQHERHWAETTTSMPVENIGQVRWPGRVLQSAFFSTLVLESNISATRPAFIREHRVCGAVTLPATGLIDLALAAATRALPPSRPGGAFLIEMLAIDQALVLAEEDSRLVQVGLETSADGAGAFRILSHPVAPIIAGGAWKTHATGRARSFHPTPAVPPIELVAMSFEHARALCTESVDVAKHFADLQQRGVEFGPLFRGVTALWRGDGDALAQIRLDTTGALDDADHVVHPGLLDACLQAIAPTLPTQTAPDGFPFAYLPSAIEKLWLGRNLPHALWSYARPRPGKGGDGDVVADFWIFTDAGSFVAAFQGLSLMRMERARLEDALRPAERGWFYQVKWESQTAVAPEKPQSSAAMGRCLILADQGGMGNALAAKLQSRGFSCVLVKGGTTFRLRENGDFEIAAGSAADFRQLVRELHRSAGAPWEHVVHLWALDIPPADGSAPHDVAADQLCSCGTALHLAQALVAEAGPSPPRVWLVSRRGTSVEDGERVDPAQGSLSGLAATLSLEHPELRCTHVDLQPGAQGSDAVLDRLLVELAANGKEDRVTLSDRQRWVARLQRLPRARPRKAAITDPGNLVLAASSSGVLDDLVWRHQSRREPGTGEVEIEVSHAGLNFRDVLTALKVVPGRGEFLGGECAGRIVAIGRDVPRFKLGDDVMAFAVGGLAAWVTVPASFVMLRPDRVDLQQAAGLPVIFLTALYAFHHLITLRAGQKVLIHAGTGGVGTAAIQLARLAGAEIFATAGTAEKRTLLKSWGVSHVFDSRSLSFASEIRAVVGERALDVVLNSLAGEFVPQSLALLRPKGIFIELGKRDLLDPADVARRFDGVAYQAFDLADIAAHDPGLIQAMLGEVARLFNAGSLRLPPMRTFPAAEAVEAFRHMAQSYHTGKIVIAMDHGRTHPDADRHLVRAGPAYFVTGGLGALGLRLARWLVDRGATHVVLAGRKIPDEATEQILVGLRASGARVEPLAVDVTDRQALALALDQVRAQSGGLRGVIHAAGVLDDSTLAELDWPRFFGVLRPKVNGAWHLHELTRGDALDFFVMFSSAASVLGAPGQGNYAAANAFLDALSHHRRQGGQHALSINWGAWAEAGMAANLSAQNRERMQSRGMGIISPAEGFQALEELLAVNATQVVAVPVDWRQYARSQPGAAVPPLLEEVVAGFAPARASLSPGRELSSLRAEVAALPEALRLPRVQSFVERQAAQALGFSSGRSIDPQRPLRDLGLDSLMSVELRNALAATLGCSLTATLLFDYPTIAALSLFLAQTVFQLNAAVALPAGAGDSKQARDLQDLTRMSEAEAEALLLAELDQPKK